MSRDVLLLAVRVVAGGALVAAFATLGDTLKPKMFAGLFAAALSVATISLIGTGLASGAAAEARYGNGMIAGAIGLAVKHLSALAGSALAWGAWLLVAGLVYWVALR